MRKIGLHIVLLMGVLLVLTNNTNAQSGLCDPLTPFYVVDLDNQPDGFFTTPQDTRKANCCGTVAPDRCIEFEVTLDEYALGLSFDIYSGAVPSGSMYYQINCGPLIAVGEHVCLSGPGPHTVTFCKPGNNPNAYIIRSIPIPFQAPNNEVRVGCQILLISDGLIPNTISWHEVTSGTGVYDTLLSCLTGCDTTWLQPTPGVPSYIDYVVCGDIMDTVCNNIYTICDTMRAFIHPQLIVPPLDTIHYCVTDGGIPLQGTAFGGLGSYDYLWYDSSYTLLSTSNAIFISTPGLYHLEIRDDLYPSCPADLQDIYVMSDYPAQVIAGLDTLICSASPIINLNGTVDFVNGAYWTSAGTGTFTQPINQLNNQYIPSATEIANKQATISLISIADTACPVAIDQKVILFRDPPELIVTNFSNVTCNGAANGFINVYTNNGTPPYVYQWNTGSTTEDISGLDTGTYQLIISDNIGCGDTITQVITEPTPITLSLGVANVACNGGNNGSLSVIATGGTPPFNYQWSDGQTGANISTLTAGTYTVTVFDLYGCSAIADTTVTEPIVLQLAINNVSNLSCFNSNDGAITITNSGGSLPYTYNWSNGASTQNLNSLTSGIYTVTLTDANGCSLTVNATVTRPQSLGVWVNSSPVSCSGGSNGFLTLSPSGGTLPYTYNWSNGSSSSNNLNLTSGSYFVTLTDANGCSISSGGFVSQPNPIVIQDFITDVNCFGNNDGNISITVTGGVIPYTYNWSNGASTKNLNNIPAGIYTLSVTDNNNCVVTNTVTIIQPTAILLGFSTTNASCNGVADGTGTMSAAGGMGPYNFIWSNGSTNQNLTNVPAGNYFVTITDNNGCSKDSFVIVSEPSVIIANLTVVKHVSCFGGNDGEIDLNVSGGFGTYVYNWSNGASTQDISNLIAGIYYVTINDDNLCQTIRSIEITQPVALAPINIDPINITCRDANDGQIDLSVTGGTPPYVYIWSNGASTEDLTNLSSATYTVTVTDNNGCTDDASTFIDNPTAIIDNAFVFNASCSGSTDGVVVTSISGGVPPYTYNWSNGSNMTNNFGLGAGTHTLTLTDANGCVIPVSYVITEPDPIVIQAIPVNISCNGGSDGSISTSPIGGSGSYNFNWSTGSNNQSINNLTAGSYDLTVMDMSGCTQIGNYNILEPVALTVSGIVSPVRCAGESNGIINITPVGGVGAYTYNWSNGTTAQNANNLSAGSYTVTVSDANGCQIILSKTLLNPPPLSVFLIADDIDCYGSANGSINIFPFGGTAPYTYNWSNGSTSPVVLNLATGTYTLTIYDARGCSYTSQSAITQPTEIILGAVKTDLTCYQSDNGSIDITLSGGTTPYTYNWSNGVATQDINNLTIGDYYLTVSDRNGCKAFYNTYINQPAELKAGATVQNASCNGVPDGNIAMYVSGGVQAYTYNWSTGASTQNLSNIPAAAYQITVTDNNGCTLNQFFIVNEPTNMTLTIDVIRQVQCSGGNDGAIDLFISGSPPSQFVWSNGEITQNISQLTAGNYFVSVSDINGCKAIAGATITEPDPIYIDPVITDISCYGLNDGSITTTIQGGQAPHTYAWSMGGNGFSQSNLFGGNYSVSVTDSLGCVGILNFEIVEPDSINIQPLIIQNVSCSGGNDGIATTITSGGTIPYLYFWSHGSGDSIVSNLATGNYSVTVRDVNGCMKDTTLFIGQPNALQASLSQSLVLCHNGSDGGLQSIVTGGLPPYSYNWSTTDTTTDITNLAPGSYTLSVTDTEGCMTITSSILDNPDSIYHNFIIGNIACFGSNTGSIDFNVFGGVPPYSYNWTTGSQQQNITNLYAGTYTVTATDTRGCDYIASTQVNHPDSMVMNVNVNNVSCNGYSDGVIDIVITGGKPPYIYGWSTGSTNNIINNLPIGTYTYSIIDNVGCLLVDSVEITQPDPLNLDATGTAFVCVGQTTGHMAANTSGGTMPYTYNWNNGSTDSLITNLGIGTYRVTVTDANNCQNNDFFFILDVSSDFNLFPSEACVNDTIHFNGFSSADSIIVSWLWDFGDGTLDTGKNIIHSFDTAGSFDINLITQANTGCFDTTTKSVLINGLPTVDAGLDRSICYNDTTTLNASGAGMYVWSPRATLGSHLSATTKAYPLSSTTYLVTGFDLNSCRNSDTVRVIIIPPPPANAGIDTAFCEGNTVTLTATGGIAYQWIKGDNLSCINCDKPDATPSQSNQYIVEVTDSNGCKNVDSVDLTVYNNPISNITGVPNITCQYSRINLSAQYGFGNTYNWEPTDIVDDSIGREVFVAQLIDPTTFVLTTTNQYGCISSDSVFIDIYQVPTDNFADTISICKGDTATVSVPGDMLHLWSPPSNVACIFCPETQVYPTVNTTYIVKSLTTDNCVTQDTIFVNILPPPFIYIGEDIVMCQGDSYQIPTVTDPNATYLWSPPKGLDSINIMRPTANAGSSMTYKLEVIDSNGCYNQDSFTLNIIYQVGLNEGADVEICYGDQVSLEAVLDTLTLFGVNYSWFSQTGEYLSDNDTYNFEPENNTSIILVTESAGSCKPDTIIYDIHVNDLPEVDAGPNQRALEGEIITLSANSGQGYSYEWFPDSAILDTSCVNCQTIQVIATGTKNYSVTVTDAKGCINDDDVNIYIFETCLDDIFVPNTFSPNNDGNNDVFRPRSIIPYTIKTMKVFDRWGNHMFETTSTDNGWDGTYQNKEVDPGVYVYYLDLTCEDGNQAIIEGNITLIR